MENSRTLPRIFIDADACPVKEEVYRVAERFGLEVTLVANTWMRVPDRKGIILKVVGDGFDEADNWIVEHVSARDIVVTADILLAGRCLKLGAQAIGSSGKIFTEDNIGSAVAMRNLLADLREAGEITGGPAPLQKSDRSRFLHQLDELIRVLIKDNSCRAPHG